MLTATKKRVEIIVERSLLDTIVELIDEVGATGYTVIPCMGGRGKHGPWRAGDLSPAFDRVYILIITSAELADAIIASAYDYLQRYSGMVSVTETQVVRADRF